MGSSSGIPMPCMTRSLPNPGKFAQCHEEISGILGCYELSFIPIHNSLKFSTVQYPFPQMDRSNWTVGAMLIIELDLLHTDAI